MRSSKSTGTSAAPSAPALITLHRHLQQHLRPTIERLRLAHSVITTSALALQQQNADADADVALLLVRCAADPIGVEIERLESLAQAFGGRAPAEPTSGNGGGTH